MTNKLYFPHLVTERLHLRNMNQSDLDFVFKHFCDKKVNEFLLDNNPITTITEAQEIIDDYKNPESKNKNRWVLFTKDENKPVGTIGFHNWSKMHHRAEIGYDLSPEFWGNGYMTEAISAVLKNGFNNMNLNRIDALVYTENKASINLLKKLNFQQEATLRDYFYLNGKYYDHYIFSLLKNEFE